MIDPEEMHRDADLLNQTIKRLHRCGAYSHERQLLALAKEIEGYREKIQCMQEHIDRITQTSARRIVVAKVKKKPNPAALVKAPPLPVGYEPDYGRRKRRQP